MKGKIYSWNDEKGFAFIEVENSKRRVFAHISDFTPQNPKPKVGEWVSFDLHSDEKGRFSAKKVRYFNRQAATKNSHQHQAKNKKQNPQQLAESKSKPPKNKRKTLPVLPIFILIFSILAGIAYYIFKPQDIEKPLTEAPKSVVSTPVVAQAASPAQAPEPIKKAEPKVAKEPPSQPRIIALKRDANTYDPYAKKQMKFTRQYQCDGRKYCSQMTSCEEATWFLQNCAGVKLDGAPPHASPNDPRYRHEPDGVPCEAQWCGH